MAFLRWPISIALGIIIILLGAKYVCSFVMDKLVKHTRWYKNAFAYTSQFFLDNDCHKKFQGDYDIVNLGSNPARFAFHYGEIKGCNWSTGTQGPNEDLEILKRYHRCLKDGATVLIPIVAFSSISPYLDKKPENIMYNAKFCKLLDHSQIKINSQLISGYDLIEHPFKTCSYSWKYLFRDAQRDCRLEQTDQQMQLLELNNDADGWMKCWSDEFDLKDFEVPLNKVYEGYMDDCVDRFGKIVEFCLEKGYHPILIFPPMSSVLNSRFSDNMREQYIYSFVRKIQQRYHKVKFLDYMQDVDFQDSELYFNSFFLNLRGRKLFTHRVLKDLHMID